MEVCNGLPSASFLGLSPGLGKGFSNLFPIPIVMQNTSALPLSGLLTPAQAASFLSLSPRTLSNWRNLKKGPAHVRLSHNDVRYRLEDLKSWLDATVAANSPSNKEV